MQFLYLNLFRKITAKWFIELSQHSLNKCVQYKKHTDPTQGHKGVKRSLSVYKIRDFINIK